MNKPGRGVATDRRVEQVVKIIGRDKARINVIEQAIRSFDAKLRRDSGPSPRPLNKGDEAIARPLWPPRPLNKTDKATARSLGWALERLEKKLASECVNEPELLDRAIYGEADEFFEWQAQLKHWRERFETFGGKAQPDGTLFDEGPTTWPLGKPKPSILKFLRKRMAAATAAAILESHGLRPTATRKSSLTGKASVFCQVAAVIFAEPRGDLYYQCRVFLETRNQGLK